MGAFTGLMTFEEFERLPEHDEDGGKLELLDGELVHMPPAFARHMRIAFKISLILHHALETLHKQGQALELGEVLMETGYRLGDNFLIPDLSVTHAGQSEGDYLLSAPALAVEVISKSNRLEEMHRKIECYFENGAREVWLFHPRTRSVTTHCGDRSSEVRDTLTTALLPGLTNNLTEIFAA